VLEFEWLIRESKLITKVRKAEKYREHECYPEQKILLNMN